MSSLLDPPKCLHDNVGNPTDLVTPGAVRNLLKTNFFLRIPQIREQDLASRTITLPPNTDVELEYRQFCAVEKELQELDRKNIVRIIRYPIFPPANITAAVTVDVEDDNVLVAADISVLNFGVGISATDDGGGHVTIVAPPLTSSLPLPVTSSNITGTALAASRADHQHEGVHSLKNSGVGTPRFGDLTLSAGSNIVITEPTSGNFKFDVSVAITTELEVSPGVGLFADHTAGHALFDGVPYTIGSGSVAVPASSTVEVYVDIDGIVKQGASAPPGTMWLATVTTDAISVTSVIERRVFVNQNFIWGSAGELSSIEPDDLAAAGVSEKYARIDHQHAIAADTAVTLNANSTNTEGVSTAFSRADHTHDLATGTPSTQNPDQANAEGTSADLARADHIHNIPADVPVTVGLVNAEGTGTSFSRNDHVHAHGDQPGGTLHALATTLVAGFMSPTDKDILDNLTEPDIQKDDVTIVTNAEIINFEGPNVTVTADSAVKATIFIGNAPGLHAPTHRPATGTDPLATAAPTVSLSATTTNATGTGDSFSRNDHTHDILTGTPVTQNPDLANAEGTSVDLARADHIHNIPADTAVSLDASSTNTEGVSTSFARADHTHDLATGTPSTQNSDQANAEGTSVNLARADHIHNIPADTAVSLNASSTNTEGTSSSFARADHTHDLSTGVVSTQNPDQANAEGTSTNLARADHIHNIPADVPVTIGLVNAEGTSSSFARADHVHAQWQVVTSFGGLPGSPSDGQIVFANYGNYHGLFIYDSTRGKWLSADTYTHTWNSNTNNATTNVNLVSHDDNTQQDNDYPNPYTITIVGLMGSQVDTIASGDVTRWEIATFDLTTATQTQNVASVSASTVGVRYGRDLTINVDVADLVVLSARRVKVSGTGNIVRPALVMFYRIRLA